MEIGRDGDCGLGISSDFEELDGLICCGLERQRLFVGLRAELRPWR